MEVIEGIFFFVLMMASFIIIIAAVTLFFRKFLGVQVTTRANIKYATREARDAGNKVGSTNKQIVDLAIKNINKKGYANSSLNIADEISLI